MLQLVFRRVFQDCLLSCACTTHYHNDLCHPIYIQKATGRDSKCFGFFLLFLFQNHTEISVWKSERWWTAVMRSQAGLIIVCGCASASIYVCIYLRTYAFIYSVISVCTYLSTRLFVYGFTDEYVHSFIPLILLVVSYPAIQSSLTHVSVFLFTQSFVHLFVCRSAWPETVRLATPSCKGYPGCCTGCGTSLSPEACSRFT